MNVQDVLIRPLITEKSLEDAKLLNEYTFEVQAASSKPQIKKAIEEIFGVKVKDVRTTKIAGKTKRFAGRFEKKMPDVKKAVVKLEEGQKIEFFEVEEKKKK